MRFGVPGLRKTLIAVAFLTFASVALVSCGSVNSNTTTTNQPSGLKFRAFVSNPVQSFSGSASPVLNIVDAELDEISASFVNLSGSVTDPGMMAVTPDKVHTLVYSGADTSLVLVTNATETVTSSGSSSGSSSALKLPGASQSMLIGSTGGSAYVAVPTAPVTGQSPGAVVVVNLSSLSIAASIPVVGVRYIVQSPDGSRILAFSDNSDSVTVIVPALVGTGNDPRTVIPGFDRPVWGLFSSDGSIAYVLNCGPQCGGGVASVSTLEMATQTVTGTVPVDAATIGLLQGSKLYVAGTPPGADCGGTSTAAATCGRLDVVDLGSMTVTSSHVITDGYHQRIAMGANGQLFVGARTCTNILASGGTAEIRGCLSIFDTGSSKVVIPPQNGDVTGIEPITDRTVVYVCQNGGLQIYDTTTDALQATQVDIIGQAVDVKVVDGPP
jgi:hypothetical protein